MSAPAMRVPAPSGESLEPRGLERAQHFALSAFRSGAGAITLVAPRARDVSVLWDEASDALVWHPAGGPALAGLGIVRSSTEGPEGIRADALGLDAHDVIEPGVVAPPLAAFGGLAFSPEIASAEPWTSFGRALFVLPRWSYGIGPSGAWLRYVVGEHASEDELLSGLRTLWARLSSDEAPRPAPGVIDRDDADEAAWDAHVRGITDAIARGEAVKVVAALSTRLRLASAASPVAVLQALARRFPGCTRFALRVDGTTFLGATPERLVEKSGTQLRTEALAGSAAVGEGESLRASAKDRHEHDVVVQAIADALAPFATRVTPGAPVLRELPNVVHLSTPIEATLARPTHVLELVRALHPTPAVGGVPRDAARRWITEREPVLFGTDAPGARGWYAAPFGAFDASGDGRFVVALRSGVLRDDRAWAFAGCGVVAGSDPRAEHAEATMKLGAFLSALEGRA
ncbi:MAG: isochorismate synthase [Polyangiales bacterium]